MNQYVTFLQQPSQKKEKVTNPDLFLLSKGKKGRTDQRLLLNKKSVTIFKSVGIETICRTKRYKFVESIAQELDYVMRDLRNWLHTEISTKPGSKADLYYKFKIPKKTGGWREITAPIDSLKNIQNHLKDLLEHRLYLIPHHNAHAYTKERSIKTNAELHKHSNHFGNIDLKDFFPSITSDLLRETLKQIDVLGCPKFNFIINTIIPIATLDDKLPQGTPLSPLLSNLVMIPFDYHMSEYLKENYPKIVVSRYADDITFSSFYPFAKDKEEAKDLLHHIVENVLERAYRDKETFKIKYEKSRISTKNGKNRITGIKVNQNHEVSIGYKEKRQIKQDLAALIIAKLHGNPEPKPVNQVIGMYNFLHSIEPEYANYMKQTLERKFNLNRPLLKFIQ